MTDEAQLREKLRKIEALFAGAGTAGEKLAAEAARQRVRARLAELERSDQPIEMQFSLPDQWARQLFLALALRTKALSSPSPTSHHGDASCAETLRRSGAVAGVPGAECRPDA